MSRACGTQTEEASVGRARQREGGAGPQQRPRAARGRLLAVAACLGLLVAPAGVAGAAEDLRLTDPELLGGNIVRVQAIVPAQLSRGDLPSAAFTVRQGDQDLQASALRVFDGDGPAEVVLVLDTTDDATTMGAEQSAAADLLRALPPETPVTVLPGGVRTTARDALPPLADLSPTPRALLDGLPDETGVRRAVVVLAGCPAVDAESRSVGGEDTSVAVLALGAGCEAGADRLAGGQPGLTRAGLDPVSVLAGVDEVASDLLGQYVLTAQVPSAELPVEVSVNGSGVSATASLTLPGQVAPLPGETPVPEAAPAPDQALVGSDDGLPTVPVALASGLAGLALLALGLELRARRRTFA